MRLSHSQLNSTLVLLWRSLGPYHLARAAAAAQRLSARAVRVVVVELCDEEETRDWRTERSDAACEVRTLAPGLRLTDRSQNLASRLLPVLDELRPSCVAVAGYDRPEMRAALRWANRQRAGAVLMSETKADDRRRPWWKRILAAREVRRADAALVSGAAASEYLVTLGLPRERIFRHYGAVDNDYFRQHAGARRRAGGRGTFLACSRMIESRKNLRRLLEAYAAYRHTSSDPWELVLCGDGPDRSAYEEFVRQERIGGVSFVGFQQIEQLAGWYARASCFVHPAINEAWGLVVNEAMASGLPVLVSRRCGCAYDLVHEGVNGFSFDPYNVGGLGALLERISRLPAAERAAMGAASQQIVARYGCEQFAEGLEAAMECAWRARADLRAPHPTPRGDDGNSGVHAPQYASGAATRNLEAPAARALQPEIIVTDSR